MRVGVGYAASCRRVGSGACSDKPWAGTSTVGRRPTARSTPAEIKDCVGMT